jgi:hypothetical protein
MTQDEIIEMAQECNLIGMRPHLDGIYTEALETFAKLVAAKEREACATLYTTPPAQPAPVQKLYNELLFAVARVHPNETRHQTALRYILQAESGGAYQCTAAHGIKEKNT